MKIDFRKLPVYKSIKKDETGFASIDFDKCISCGKCFNSCPYHAIVHIPIPCEEACPVGAITKDEAHMHARKNVITRAIGANANNEPDCFSVPVEKGDRILLCSDGLYDEVDDDTILSVLNRYDDMKVCAEDLVYMANENGGNDNISVICVDLED